MKIGTYSIEAYAEVANSFHGVAAPGMMLGGFMVDTLMRRMQEGRLYNVICETNKCLPDAVQLLTPCTTGNGRLRVFSLGRYALTLYDKFEGQGVRAFVDSSRVENWSEIADWYYKRKPKNEQDRERLDHEIKTAGAGICGFEEVQVSYELLKKQKEGTIAICPVCSEGYPLRDGPICRACQGESPYLSVKGQGRTVSMNIGTPMRENREILQPRRATGHSR